MAGAAVGTRQWGGQRQTAARVAAAPAADGGRGGDVGD